mgnify:FL=1
MVIAIHVFLSIVMFFGMNALGHFSPSSLNYHQLTSFLETDEAPAFNYLIRVLTPVVGIILLSTLFYSLNWNILVVNIYMINVYYVFFRIAFNLSINRGLLINWKRQFIYSFSIIIISYFLYEKFIKIKANLFPDFSNIANELWIIILVFIYHFINNLQYSDLKANKRKNKYLSNRYSIFKKKYGKIITSNLIHENLKFYLYGIMIYEDFNRPRLFRWMEYIKYFIYRKPLTMGIMQVSSDSFIGDRQSIIISIKRLSIRYEQLLSEYNSFVVDGNETEYQKEYRQSEYLERLLQTHNIRSDYSYEIKNIVDEICLIEHNCKRPLLFK